MESDGVMRQRLIRTLIVVVLLFWAAVQPDVVPAQEPRHERILDFLSDIVIHKDASLTVKETILVQALGHTIKRGIVRDFPTIYKDRLGHRVRCPILPTAMV